ncbi:hypothetical protein ABKV19_024695 [Rosa sericea]
MTASQRNIRLCQECQTLIENHDKIKLLSNARNNLNTTLKVWDATAADPKLLVFLKSYRNFLHTESVVNMESRNNRFSFLISLLQLVLRKLDRIVPEGESALWRLAWHTLNHQ